MSTTENTILSEQIGQLHSEVHKVAETIVTLYNMQRTIDQKANVIGKAMIEQKAKTDVVTKNQAAMEEKVAECRSYADQRRQMINASIEDVVGSIQQMRSLEDREDTLLKSMEKLSKNQTNFMNYNVSFSKKAEQDLTKVKSAVDDIRSTLNHMNISDQVTFMNAKAVEIQKGLASYVSTRIKSASVMEQRTKRMEEQIMEMQGAITEQKKAVDSIVAISKACEEKTVNMCDKLEKLLSYSSKTMAVKPELSLEDMFSVSVEAKDTSTSPDFTMDTKDDTVFSIPTDDLGSVDDIFSQSDTLGNMDPYTEPAQEFDPNSLESTFGGFDQAPVKVQEEPDYAGYGETIEPEPVETGWEGPVENGLSIHVMPAEDTSNMPNDRKGFLARIFGGARA